MRGEKARDECQDDMVDELMVCMDLEVGGDKEDLDSRERSSLVVPGYVFIIVVCYR